MGALDDYMKQVKSYPAGNPGTSVPDDKRKKKGFQPAENFGMPMPSPLKKSSLATESEKINMNPEGYVAPGTTNLFKRAIGGIVDATVRGPGLGALFGKNPSATGVGSSLMEPAGYVESGQRDIFDALGDMRDKQRAERRARELPNKNPYDETSWRNPQMPHQRPTTSSSAGPQSDVAGLSKALDVAGQKNINRFDPSKLTIGNNEFTGQVGLFKDGQMLDSSKMRLSGGNLGGTPLPAGQQTTFNRISVPMPGGAAAPTGGTIAQSGAGFTGTTNYTNLFAQDAKIGAMQLANAKNDYRIGEGNPKFFTGPGEPGPGSYGADSMATQLAARRDTLIKQLDDVRARSGMSMNPSFDERLNFQIQTKGLQNEIANIDQQIFGRTDLANKIQQALIGQQTALGQQGLANKGGLDKQLAENAGTMGVRTMMEGHEDTRHAATLGAGMETAATAERSKSIAEFKKVLNERYGKVGEKYFQHLLDNGQVNEENLGSIASKIAQLGVNEDDDAALMKIFGTK